MTMTNAQRVAAEADATVRSLIAGVEPDAAEPIQRGDVFDTAVGVARSYMIGGGGPTTHATVVPDPMETGALMVLVDVHGSEAREHRVITGPVASRIAAALRAAA